MVKYGPLKFTSFKGKRLQKILDKEKDKLLNSSFEEILEEFLALLLALYETAGEIRKTIIVEKLIIKSKIGFEDAAVTGLVVGLAYAEIYKLFGLLNNIFTIQPPSLTITPVYEDNRVFEAEVEGIIKTKLAHIIFTEAKYYNNYTKHIKERDD